MKTCTMNCGPAAGDTRTQEQRQAECTDCVENPQPQPKEKQVERIKIIPTWRAILPLLVEVAANGKEPKARSDAMGELYRLADAADTQVAAAEKPLLKGDALLHTSRTMSRFGGGFAKAIADAALAADTTNAQRLQQAFPELFERFGPGSSFYAENF